MVNFKTKVEIPSIDVRVRLGLISDLHFGNASLVKSALKADLERMDQAECHIGINGDVFDLVLPGDIKRFSLDSMDKALLQQGLKPIDAAIDMAYEFLKPYAHRIKFIGIGNHEAHVTKHHHVDCTKILLYRLNQLPGVKVEYGGWCGYWQIRIVRGTQVASWVQYRHHGAGGAAVVTKGMIDFNRMLVWQGDIDGLWIGHKHNKFVDLATKMTYDRQNGTAKTDQVTCVMTGSYLSTYGTDKEAAPSYAMGWNLAPQQYGGVILELRHDAMQQNNKRTLRVGCRVIL
jgi:hypothetical protein